MSSATERFDTLVRWVRGAGGGLNPDVEIYQDEVYKASFRVRDSFSISQDDVIVTLPLSKSLSFLNAIHDSTVFPAEFIEKTPPHVVGRFFLMQQYLLGRESKWWPYIQTLPQPSQMSSLLPTMWPSDDVEFLRGTNAYVAVQEIKSTLKKEHKRAVRLLPERDQFEYTRPLYHWAYSIYTSRSFRPSLILPNAEDLTLPCKIDDFSVLLPLFDIGNHSTTAKTAWNTEGEGEQAVCMFRSGQAYSAGEQVFNNYGLKTNAEMLLGYGFILPECDDFHNDYVHIKTKADPQVGDLVATHVVSLRPLAHPSSLVGRQRLLERDSADCLPCFSHVQDSLIAALYESVNGSSEENDDTCLRDIMSGNIPKEQLHNIVDALGSKLSVDLEELEACDPEYEACNRNQELALAYREQCRKVLGNTLQSLSTGRI
ncbi:SET domain-containing protein [Xylariomycetidae sp. FL2044]|nr:SET domain-containing protein [Xylariomycetidae sp. FL2044]